jgi:hypothetical protein
MTTLEDRISTFIPKALTKAQTVHAELMEEFDYKGYQNEASKELLARVNETYNFVELLNTTDRGALTSKQISDLIDFFTDILDLNTVIAANYTNYFLPIVNNTIILPSGNYATVEQLAAEIQARIDGDLYLLQRIEALEALLADFDPGDVFPDNFFDNYNTTYAAVFDDDPRLHTHDNKDELDQIDDTDITNIKSLTAHYESIGNPDGQHVSPEDRALWNSAAANWHYQTVRTITQEVEHGYSVKDVLTLDNAGEHLKVSDPSSEFFIGLVSEVIDAFTFKLVLNGYVIGLSGLTPGQRYYAQADGQLGPAITNLAVLIATSATTGYIIAGGGNIAPSGGGIFDDTHDNSFE